MKILQRVILLAGFSAIGLLLWSLDPASVLAQVSSVGWGILVILPFQFFDHMLNAQGWRFAFTEETAADVPFWCLMKARIAGDGVNYLTPSGTIAGELVRPAMLGDVAPVSARNCSVVVAKFAQALGQMAFILVGLLFVILGHMNLLEGRELVLSVCGTVLSIAIIASSLYILTAAAPWAERLWRRSPKIAELREQMRGYLREHPGRFMGSTVCFMLGFAWGGLEVALICYFMGVRITPFKALAVEVLSNLIDSLFFFVPAKVGTQEAGKVAIFRLVGYRASVGLAFGLVRHLREFLWACAGFGVYALSKAPAPRPAPRARLPRPTAPLSSAD